ncbi:MAG TPA: hypothetical protein VMR62_13555 [Bryobacteraceae bacterium]|jgi:serine/threonine protein kinase|nr:hypothetical protein [Bryobacteraceae bacterium]
MLTKNGAVLLDFGGATRELAASPAPTDNTATLETHTVAGTPPYMSPEQLQVDAVDTRADIFSGGRRTQGVGRESK